MSYRIDFTARVTLRKGIVAFTRSDGYDLNEFTGSP